MLGPLPRLLILISLGAGLALMGLTAGSVVRQEACPPSFDEAVHALPAYEVAADLRRLDLSALARQAYGQDDLALYPFLHSWLVAPFLLIFGPTVTVARLANVFLLGLATLATWFLAAPLAPRASPSAIAGTGAVALMLTAMPLWVYAGQVYLEAAGLLITTLCLIAYSSAAPSSPRRRRLLATSALMAAAFFTKYAFGVFLAAGIGLAELLYAAQVRRAPLRRWLWLFGPAGLAVVAWFANPAKLANFLAFSQSQQANLPPQGLAYLLYYARSLLHVYYANPIVAGLALAGLIWGLWRFRDHRHRALITYCLATLLLLTLVPQREHRFTYTLLSASAALAGGVVGDIFALVERAVAGRRPRRTAALVALLLLFLAGVGLSGRRYVHLGAAMEMAHGCPPSDLAAAYGFVREQSGDLTQKPYLLNEWHQFNRYALVWTHVAGRRWEALPAGYGLASGGLAPAPTAANLTAFRDRLRQENVSLLISIDGSPAGDNTGWQVVEPLWAAGALEGLASSQSFTVLTWSRAYEEQALRGLFRDREEQVDLRDEGRRSFQIQLHVYALR